ncbi:MAG TPA: hypothetical protein VLE74_02030 [Candidatus Saccharimonadales bacterium]|nr:hypothetical protein [Candidatus Saccharimonadales bacterium]
MTATNHALTGALIGLSVHQPVVAIALAFLSHFLLDAIPHYGSPKGATARGFATYLMSDASLCFLLVVILLVAQPVGWIAAVVCAFVATSPDFMWVGEFLGAQNGKKPKKPTYALARFHNWVQWFERPVGWVVEAAWAIGATMLLAKLI